MFQFEQLRRLYEVGRRVPGLEHWLHQIADRVFPHGSRVWVRTVAGKQTLHFSADPRFEPSYVRGCHEPWVGQWLENHLRPGDCCYDLGAHHGYFTIRAASIVGPTGMVYAFEPDPDNGAVLQRNADENRLCHIRLIQAAVWWQTGQVSFERSNMISSAGFVGRVTAFPVPDAVQVASIALDDFVFHGDARAPSLIKIDVEGAEQRVLAGATRTLDEVHPSVICEVHDPATAASIVSFLADFRYSVVHWIPEDNGYDIREHFIWTT